MARREHGVDPIEEVKKTLAVYDDEEWLDQANSLLYESCCDNNGAVAEFLYKQEGVSAFVKYGDDNKTAFEASLDNSNISLAVQFLVNPGFAGPTIIHNGYTKYSELYMKMTELNNCPEWFQEAMSSVQAESIAR